MTVQVFQPDRQVYRRDHVIMALGAAVFFYMILLLIGNEDPWVALPAAALAIGIRGWYLASEVLAERWSLGGGRLTGPAERDIGVHDITSVNRLGSAVQIITRAGDKHLIKYQADAARVQAAIQRVAGL